MKVEMSIITDKGKIGTKICYNSNEQFIYERDMPAKHGLLYSGKPYLISCKNLEL